jgi:hypothetical protein
MGTCCSTEDEIERSTWTTVLICLAQLPVRALRPKNGAEGICITVERCPHRMNLFYVVAVSPSIYRYPWLFSGCTDRCHYAGLGYQGYCSFTAFSPSLCCCKSPVYAILPLG